MFIQLHKEKGSLSRNRLFLKKIIFYFKNSTVWNRTVDRWNNSHHSVDCAIEQTILSFSCGGYNNEIFFTKLLQDLKYYQLCVPKCICTMAIGKLDFSFQFSFLYNPHSLVPVMGRQCSWRHLKPTGGLHHRAFQLYLNPLGSWKVRTGAN